jgi:hypothetical protein
MGVKHIYRETLYTSIFLAIDVLKESGLRNYTSTRKGMDFIRYDEQALHKLAKHRKDMKSYVFNVREQIEQQERLLSADLNANMSEADTAWDSEPMRYRLNYIPGKRLLPTNPRKGHGIDIRMSKSDIVKYTAPILNFCSSVCFFLLIMRPT